MFDYHQSALDGAGDPAIEAVCLEFNMNSLTEWMVGYGIPSDKINMGVAFYGRSVQTELPADLGAATIKRNLTVQPDGPVSTALDDTNFKIWDGTPMFRHIEQIKGDGWTEHWDDQRKFLT